MFDLARKIINIFICFFLSPASGVCCQLFAVYFLVRHQKGWCAAKSVGQGRGVASCVLWSKKENIKARSTQNKIHQRKQKVTKISGCRQCERVWLLKRFSVNLWNHKSNDDLNLQWMFIFSTNLCVSFFFVLINSIFVCAKRVSCKSFEFAGRNGLFYHFFV